jgi:hypothetical protein
MSTKLSQEVDPMAPSPNTGSSCSSVEQEEIIEANQDSPARDEITRDVEKARKVVPITALDWDGPDDVENPINWPTWKRYFHVVPPAIISFSAFASP